MYIQIFMIIYLQIVTKLINFMRYNHYFYEVFFFFFFKGHQYTFRIDIYNKNRLY